MSSSLRSWTWKGWSPKDSNKEKNWRERKVRSYRGNLISSKKCIWIVRNTTRSSSITKEVSWEESQINTAESRPKVNTPKMFWNMKSSSLFPPVINSGKDSKNSTSRENVVEMGNNSSGVVERNVKTSVCKGNSTQSSNSEEEDESDRKQSCWLWSISCTTVSCCQPAKDLNTGWNGDDDSCSSKVRTCINVSTNSISVVSSN